MPYKWGAEPYVKEVGEFIYETLTEFGPTYHFPGFRLGHSTRRRLHLTILVENPIFQHWRPPRVGQAKPTMARKRAASARVTLEPVARGRPRRNARSTYASASEDQTIEEPIVEDQPPIAEEQQAPDPTLEQVLQQLQAQLQST